MADTEKLSPLTPVPLAFLMCDQVISDATTKKKSLIGVFDRILVRGFPSNYQPVTLYARLVDAEGQYEFTIDYVKSDSEQRLGQVRLDVTIADRQRTNEFAVVLPPLVLPEPGEYEFRLWANGRYIHRARFVALLIEGEGVNA